MRKMMMGFAAAAMLVGAAAPAAMAQNYDRDGYYDRDSHHHNDRDRDRYRRDHDRGYHNGYYRGYHYGWRNNRCSYGQRGWYDQWRRWHWC